MIRPINYNISVTFIWNIVFSGGDVTRRKSLQKTAETETEQKTAQKVIASVVVGACDPDDRLRATEGGFLMTDMADVESIAEPTNNGKVVP